MTYSDTAFAQSNERLAVYLGSYQLAIQELFRDKEDNLYIPAGYLGLAIGAIYRDGRDGGIVSIEKDRRTVSMDPDFKLHSRYQVMVNGRITDIPLPLKKAKGTILLPLVCVSDLLQLKLSFTKGGKTYYIPRPGARKPSVSPKPQPSAGVQKKEPAPPRSYPPPRDSRYQPARKESKKAEDELKRFGFYLGLSHLKPEIQGLGLERSWSLFGSASVKLIKTLALELRYDTYRSSQTGMYLGAQSDVDVKTRGLTGYILYCFPRDIETEKWEFDVGFGWGQHKFDLFYDSATVNYHRWFKLDAFEIKLGAEYCFTENWRMGLELRGIFGDDQIALTELGQTVSADLDGVYIGLSQRYCF